MTGMTTSLHIMADGPGEYSGRAAEINGRGYAGMTFAVKSTAVADFDAWVASVKESPLELTVPAYNELVKPSEDHPVAFYSYVEKNLFHRIVMKYMHPEEPISVKSFSRFSGSFEPIFDSNSGGNIRHAAYYPPNLNRKAAKIIPKIDEKFY